MKFVKIKLFISALSLYISLASASTLSKDTDYEVCFTPGQNCTQLIVDKITEAKSAIKVQGYSFTSVPILQALVAANKRGVDVKVILDKSQYKDNKYTSATYLTNNFIPVWIDTKVSIAHNKVMIFDSHIVLTGSFNFTKAAQYRNAENILIINNANLAKQYECNWTKRLLMSDNSNILKSNYIQNTNYISNRVYQSTD
jgi:phosphatidylserine/phosphatidylglycerophosphate/cardiolipin synthase-like enzyme